ncbi:hypothetical protein I6K77_23545 [Escherichia coli]|nr:hypothetical protein [Escherichia coli]MBN3645154.1 hypothetical protein [Escherichia coli]
MTEQQIRLVCRQCMDRCRAGETWPPDLAEFVALISESGANPFGLTVDAVMEERRCAMNPGDTTGVINTRGHSLCCTTSASKCVPEGLSAR